MGPWGIALAVLLGATLTESGRGVLRKITREVIRAGYVVSDKSSAVVGDLKEKTADLIAEVKAEQAESDGHSPKTATKTKKAAAEKNSTDN